MLLLFIYLCYHFSKWRHILWWWNMVNGFAFWFVFHLRNRKWLVQHMLDMIPERIAFLFLTNSSSLMILMFIYYIKTMLKHLIIKNIDGISSCHWLWLSNKISNVVSVFQYSNFPSHYPWKLCIATSDHTIASWVSLLPNLTHNLILKLLWVELLPTKQTHATIQQLITRFLFYQSKQQQKRGEFDIST